MTKTIESFLEEAQEMGLKINEDMIPYMKRAISRSKKERRDGIELAFKKSREFREYYSQYEEAQKRYTTSSNICYIDARIRVKNFTTPEMDEVMLAGIADYYLFNIDARNRAI